MRHRSWWLWLPPKNEPPEVKVTVLRPSSFQAMEMLGWEFVYVTEGSPTPMTCDYIDKQSKKTAGLLVPTNHKIEFTNGTELHYQGTDQIESLKPLPVQVPTREIPDLIVWLWKIYKSKAARRR